MAIGKIQEHQVKYKLQERLIDGDESATFLSVRTIQGHVRIHTHVSRARAAASSRWRCRGQR